MQAADNHGQHDLWIGDLQDHAPDLVQQLQALDEIIVLGDVLDEALQILNLAFIVHHGPHTDDHINRLAVFADQLGCDAGVLLPVR